MLCAQIDLPNAAREAVLSALTTTTAKMAAHEMFFPAIHARTLVLGGGAQVAIMQAS